MVGLLALPALALLIALAFGGSPTGWRGAGFRWWPLGCLMLLAQAFLFSPLFERESWAVAWGPWIWVATLVGVLAVLAGNALATSGPDRWCLSAAAIGVLLNVLVVTANGGYMPRLAPPAPASAGVAAAVEAEGGSVLTNVVPLDEDTRLPWLGDVIVQPAWLPLRNIVSVGDLLLSAGIAGWLLTSTLRVPRRRVRVD